MFSGRADNRRSLARLGPKHLPGDHDLHDLRRSGENTKYTLPEATMQTLSETRRDGLHAGPEPGQAQHSARDSYAGNGEGRQNEVFGAA